MMQKPSVGRGGSEALRLWGFGTVGWKQDRVKDSQGSQRIHQAALPRWKRLLNEANYEECQGFLVKLLLAKQQPASSFDHTDTALRTRTCERLGYQHVLALAAQALTEAE